MSGGFPPATLSAATFSFEGTIKATTGALRYTTEGVGRITQIIAAVGTAPSGGSCTFDVLVNGTSILGSNLVTITTGKNSGSVTLTTTKLLAPLDYVTVSIISVTAPAADATVTVYGEGF